MHLDLTPRFPESDVISKGVVYVVCMIVLVLQ